MRALSRSCQLLCPPNRQMGTFAHSQLHATIRAKLFCFSRNVENRTVVFGSPPALGAGGPEFKSRHPDHFMFFFHHLATYLFFSYPCEFLVGRRSAFASHSISMTSLYCEQARTQKG